LDKSQLEQPKIEKANETEALKTQKQDAIACSLDDPEGCEMCGS
jgi:ribonucleoside-diphosphate reductase alpha chain